MIVCWTVHAAKGTFKVWRLHNYLLLNKGVNTKARQEITFFHCNNKTPNKIILWETFKVFTRGILIGQKAYLNKQRQQEIKEQLQETKELERQHKVSYTQESKARLNAEVSS